MTWEPLTGAEEAQLRADFVKRAHMAAVYAYVGGGEDFVLKQRLLATLDGEREDARRWRQNMHLLGDALSHAASVHGYRCDCDRVMRTTDTIDFADLPPIE